MTNQITETKLSKLSVFDLYKHYSSIEKAIPLLSIQSQDLAKAELEQCSKIRSEKIDRIYYAWAHHEDAVDRIKKEQELLSATRKHHESQVSKLKSLLHWLGRTVLKDSNRIQGKNYEFVLSKKKNLTVEICIPIEEWDEADQKEYCLKQTVTTTKHIVLSSLEGDVVEQTNTPITKTEIIPNVNKICAAYQQGTKLPNGIKIQQDYNIKRNRIVLKKSMEELSPEYSTELLPELESSF
jgi:hypothetical protein